MCSSLLTIHCTVHIRTNCSRPICSMRIYYRIILHLCVHANIAGSVAVTANSPLSLRIDVHVMQEYYLITIFKCFAVLLTLLNVFYYEVRYRSSCCKWQVSSAILQTPIKHFQQLSHSECSCINSLQVNTFFSCRITVMTVRSDNKLTLYVAQILRLMLMVCLLTSHDITVVRRAGGAWGSLCGVM